MEECETVNKEGSELRGEKRGEANPHTHTLTHKPCLRACV